MLDIATAYNKFGFLGNEFLTWIWYLIETRQDISQLISAKEPISLEIGNSIVLENNLGEKSKERITIKGDKAGLEEGRTALKKGAQVTDINLNLTVGEEAFKFSIKGESFNLTGLKPPTVDTTSSEDQLEGLVMEKAFLLLKVIGVIDSLFLKFMDLRSADDWKTKEFHLVKHWVHS